MRVWRNDFFDKSRNPTLADYANVTEYERAILARNETIAYFKTCICNHIQECARVIGMTCEMTNGMPTQVTDGRTIAQSLQDDASILNVQRACFIFHFSVTNSYTSLFGISFYEYHERRFMRATNTVYRGSARHYNSSCVAQMGAKVLNREKFLMQNRLKTEKISFSVTKPDDWPHEVPMCRDGGAYNNVYYISSGGNRYRVSCEPGERDLFWTVVP